MKDVDPRPDSTGPSIAAFAEVDAARGRGALLGLACGDALGTTLEFTSPMAPAFPTLAIGPHRDIIGAGPFRLQPGQVTDDTHMATALAASLTQRGAFEPEDVAARYVAWTADAFDVGNQTRAALHRIARGCGPEQAGYEVWEASGFNAAGNGSLMRTLPIGLFYAGDRRRLLDAAMRESAITHADPRCQLACAAYDAAIACGARDLGGAEDMTAAAVAALDEAGGMLLQRMADHADRVRTAHAEVASDLRAASHDDPGVVSSALHIHRHAGFVRVALRLAFWHLLHTPSLEGALIDVVNRGGDADTNGAIVGGLLGAAHGESALPQRWRRTVMNALAGEAGPLATTYHPRELLRMIR